jgi:O-antigen/teichoic acid export membrane protein
MNAQGAVLRFTRLTEGMLRSRGSGVVAAQMFATQVLVVVLNMASGIATARLLGASGRGLFAAATLWPQLLLAVFCFGFPAAITYHIRGTPEARGTIYTATLLLGAIMSCVAVAVGLVVVPFAMRSYTPQEILLAEFCVLATVTTIFQLLVKQVAISLHLFTLFNLACLLAPLLYLLLMLAAWLVFGLTVHASIVSLYAGVVIATVVNFLQLRRHCALAVSGLGLWMRRLTSYAMRGAVADILSGLSGNIDRLVLVFLITPEMLGLYAVALGFSRLMLVLQTVINSFVFSKLVGRPKVEIVALHNQVFRLMAYIVLGAAMGSLLIGRQVIMLLYGREFGAAHMMFVVLTFEAAMTCTAQVTAQTLYALNRPGSASLAQTAGFVTALAGMLLLAPSFGGIGAAIGMATASFVRGAVLLRAFARFTESGLPRLLPERSDIAFVRSLFRA